MNLILENKFKLSDYFFRIVFTMESMGDEIAKKLLDVIDIQGGGDVIVDIIKDNPAMVLMGGQIIRVGRLLRNLLESLEIEYTDSDIEKFVNLYRSVLEEGSVDFQIWKGERIREAYKKVNYQDLKGSLGHSCMNDNINDLDFYVDNPKVSILVGLKGDKIIGRSLLWEIDGGKFYLDRIYNTYDHYSIMFENWAKERGYLYWDNVNLNDIKMSITGLKLDYKVFPYMDTFQYYINGGVVSWVDDFQKGLVEFISQSGLHNLSKSVIVNPYTEETELYYISWDKMGEYLYRDLLTGQEYLISDCSTYSRVIFGESISIKSHKMIIDRLDRMIRNWSVGEKFSEFILYFIDHRLNNISLKKKYDYRYQRLWTWEKSGNKIITDVYPDYILGRGEDSIGKLEIIERSGGRIEIKFISNKSGEHSVVAKNLSDLFNNKLTNLFSKPQVRVEILNNLSVIRKNWFKK
jgi:hypothetical protein